MHAAAFVGTLTTLATDRQTLRLEACVLNLAQALGQIVRRGLARLPSRKGVKSPNSVARHWQATLTAIRVATPMAIGERSASIARRLPPSAPTGGIRDNCLMNSLNRVLIWGSPRLCEFLKNNDQAIHTAVSTWVSGNSVVASLEQERVRHRRT
jgi:hypothetical protein